MHFNPRSREGSDVVFIHWSFIVAYFNPRSREGSDGGERVMLRPEYFISIHAPAKGATAEERGVSMGVANFNPRSREGSDSVGLVREYYVQDFNPRSREGSDELGDLSKDADCRISIHAPAKGATAFINIFSLAVRLFFISSHQ